MKNSKITKTEVINALVATGKTKITFRKQDGTIREMTASLKKSDILPVRGKKSHKSQNLITVVDVDKNDWRSFYLDDVISVRKDFRSSYGVRFGNEVVKFATRSNADKVRSHLKEIKNIVSHHSL